MEVSSEEIPAAAGRLRKEYGHLRERHSGGHGESTNIHFLKKNNVILARGLPVGEGQSWFGLRRVRDIPDL